jgi:hypothetical protein
MTTIIRPVVFRSTHPFITTLRIAQRHAPRSTFGLRYNSTALDKDVKDREEHSRSDAAVVGGSGQGAEGVHFQGTLHVLVLLYLRAKGRADDRSNDQFTFDPNQRQSERMDNVQADLH